LHPDLEFSRLESWSRDVSRPVFTSLGLGLGLEPRSFGLGTLESRSRSWDGDSVFVTHEAWNWDKKKIIR